MKSEIQNKLEQLAYSRTTPFCYSCYINAPNGVCSECHSDDLMRHLDGVGVEWGTSWVIKHILEEELTAVDEGEVFEESMRQCYPEETTVGWMKFDTVELMKSQDPISWEMARDEYISSLESDEQIISFDGEIISGMAGTRTAWKATVQSEKLFGIDIPTGNKSLREVEEFVIHPDLIKSLRVGKCVCVKKYPSSRAYLVDVASGV